MVMEGSDDSGGDGDDKCDGGRGAYCCAAAIGPNLCVLMSIKCVECVEYV